VRNESSTTLSAVTSPALRHCMEQQCITKRHSSVSQKIFYTPEVFDNFSQRLRIFKLKFYTPIVRSGLHKTAKFF